MSSLVLYPLALLGLVTALAFGALLVLVVFDHHQNKTDHRAGRRIRRG